MSVVKARTTNESMDEMSIYKNALFINNVNIEADMSG